MQSQDETNQNTRRQGTARSQGKPRRARNQEDAREARMANEHPGARSWLFLTPPWLLLSSFGMRDVESTMAVKSKIEICIGLRRHQNGNFVTDGIGLHLIRHGFPAVAAAVVSALPTATTLATLTAGTG